MLTNAQMISNRFGRWARARRMVNAIRSHLAAGHTVMLYTHLKATKFAQPEHAEMFKAALTSASNSPHPAHENFKASRWPMTPHR